MIVNWKLTSAFTTGAMLASGIVYYAVRPPDTRHAEISHVVAPKPSLPPPAVAKAVPIIPAPVRVPARPATERPPVAAPPRAVVARAAIPAQHPIVREKPSPMPPPIRHDRPAAVAKLEPVEPAPLPPPPAVHDQTSTPVPAPVTSLPQSAPAPVAPAPAPAPVTSAPAPTNARVTPVPVPSATSPSARENVPLRNVLLPAPNSEARVPHTVTLAAGTLLTVRIGETLSSARNQPGDTFLATLTQPLVIDGWIIAERGARVEGRVLDASQGGRVSGAAHLGISIVRFATSDGQNIRIHTDPLVKDAGAFTGTDAAKIGAGAAIGAAIGAIAGGGKGAAIGAGAGGAIGAGDVLLTRGLSAEIRVESRINFKVQDSVTITERLD